MVLFLLILSTFHPYWCSSANTLQCIKFILTSELWNSGDDRSGLDAVPRNDLSPCIDYAGFYGSMNYFPTPSSRTPFCCPFAVII
ncbi:hypothetical protein BJY04DRAFT_180677, partial [Aspergillus karnatakaensis]|uniref:uncharacterized protein n=1 Tax=Aspergillus karnatakaensis TaxID=1810916 RepID=UPI003CCE53F8